MPGLSDRLSATRGRQFVGRTRELEVLQAALSGLELACQILFIYGPNGVGKTTLLQEYARLCAAAEAHTYYLDAHDFAATPESFIAALRQALRLPDERSLLHTLAEQPGVHVFLIDTTELLRPIDQWMHEVCLPQLPENTLVIMSGREPPSAVWQADAGGQTMIRTLPLRNFTPSESRAFLDHYSIPEDQQALIVNFTHGFPLALALISAAFAQQPDRFIFELEAPPDLVKVLLEHFVQHILAPEQRAALGACALVHVTTESLLGQMLDIIVDGSSIYEWLSDLAFIEANADGLFPHDLVREVLSANLRRHNPARYTELQQRARCYYTVQISRTRGFEQQRWLNDFVFLCRDDPAIRSLLAWQPNGSFPLAGLQEADRDAWLARLAQYDAAADLAITATAPVTPLIALSAPEFSEAVGAALRDFTQPDRLAANPLSRSRLAIDRTGGDAAASQRAAALQASLVAAAETLLASPREAQLYRAVYHTYLRPAPTPEQAAEMLEVPFSIYRRHLQSGLQRITAILWQQEIGG